MKKASALHKIKFTSHFRQLLSNSKSQRG